MFKGYFIEPLPVDPLVRRSLIETLVFTSLYYLGFTLFAVYLSKSGQDDWLMRYTKDDGLIEWLQFLLYFSVALFTLFTHYVFRKTHKIEWTSWASVGLLIVVTVFAFGAMEEISWGQRLVGRTSTEFFAQYNKQGETNLHNLVVNDVSINRLIFGKILFLFIFAHNIVIPFLAVKRPGLTNWFNEKMGGCYPPLLFSSFYILGAILVELIAHERRKELLELIGGAHYLTMVFVAYGMGFQTKNPIFSGRASLLASRAFMGFLIALAGLAWCLSVSVRTS